jgi:transposase InsO family protein
MKIGMKSARYSHLFQRQIVGWCMSSSLEKSITLNALQMALDRRNPSPGLLHHSDRGVQYACEDYQKLLKSNAMTCSMSRKGNCWDNAPMESFFHTLKVELIHHRTYATREEARRDIFEYVEIFYNRQRLHSSLGYRSPVDYETQNQFP